MPDKIFGIGLNKTGTKTLKKCLNLLGFDRHVSCRFDLLVKYRNGQVFDIFDEIDKNNSFEDWPWPLMYKEIFFRYGDKSKFILTRRKNDKVWLESLKNHSLSIAHDRHCRLMAYGYNYPHGMEEFHKKYYNNHNDKVKSFFKKHKAEHSLLEISFDSGDGWHKLCDFLGVRVPDFEFPHENAKIDTANNKLVNDNKVRINEQLRLLGKLNVF